MSLYLQDISTLSPEARKVLLHIIRHLIPLQLPELLKERGLEATEELILEMIQNGMMKLYRDGDVFWLEKVGIE